MSQRPPRVYADPQRAQKLKQGYFASFDPGTRNPAAALFYKGELIQASRVKVPAEYADLDYVERCRRIAPHVATWIRSTIFTHAPPGTIPAGDPAKLLLALGCEFQEVYKEKRGDKALADPNDLLLLACLAGAVAVELGVETISPRPKDWSTIPKKEREFKNNPWESPRGRVLASRLTELEKARIQPTHDALDATGIGMKILCRLEKSLPGTTK
jgi:hypothetical protein